MIKDAISAPACRVLAGSIVLLALAPAMAACSSSGSPSAAAGTRSPAGPMQGATYQGVIYVNSEIHGKPGPWHLMKTFVDRVAHVQNCAATAKTGSVYRVPSPPAPLPQVSIVVTGFRGPGTYPPSTLKKDKADTIVVTGKPGQGRYIITSAAHGVTAGKEVLAIRKDGSGELVYSGAHLNGKAASPAVAGLIQWKCTS